MILVNFYLIAHFLANIHIGLSPTSLTPTVDNFDVCNIYYGSVEAGETKAFMCLKTGRLVIIQLNSLADSQTIPSLHLLTLCEVEVYGGE